MACGVRGFTACGVGLMVGEVMDDSKRDFSSSAFFFLLRIFAVRGSVHTFTRFVEVEPAISTLINREL